MPLFHRRPATVLNIHIRKPERQDESVSTERQTSAEHIGGPGIPVADVDEDDYLPNSIRLEDSGVHALPEPEPQRAVCPHCFGTGHLMTTSDMLRQSLKLLHDDPASHQVLIAEFYRRLLSAAPHLVPLFPPDLTDANSTGEGKIQRDKLLGALIAVSQSYNPDAPDSEGMQILRTHLDAFGRSHAAFQRSDGTVRGASVQEYAAVFTILMGTLHDLVGPAWVPAFDAAWDEAYDFAARGMIASAWSAGFKSARYPRP